MKPDFKKAIDLHHQGYTPEEISTELGISRATAYRWIQQHETSLTMAGMNDDDQNSYVETITNTPSANRLAGILEKEHRIKSTKLQRETLKSFKALMEGLEEHTAGSEWSGEEIRKVANEVAEIVENVEEACSFEADEYQDLSIYEISLIIKSLFKTYLSLFPSGVQLDWDGPKIEMIKAGLAIKSFDETDFDVADYQRQTAWHSFTRYIDQLTSLEGKSFDPEEVDDLISDLKRIREEISEDLPEDLKEEFESEVQLLDDVETFLKEYRIRTEESFFGKRLALPSDLIDKINNIIEGGSDD